MKVQGAYILFVIEGEKSNLAYYKTKKVATGIKKEKNNNMQTYYQYIKKKRQALSPKYSKA